MKRQATRLSFIRHGQSEGNLNSGYVNGRSNHFALSELGERQAELVGLWLRREVGTPDVVYASPAKRAMRTGEIALSAAGVSADIIIEDDVQEVDQGDWTGRLRTGVYTPEVIAKIDHEGMDFRAPGGESIRDVMCRMHDAAEIMAEGNVWVFGHGLSIRCLAGAVMGWSREEILARGDVMFNTAVTQFSRDDNDCLELSEFASATHLPPDMRSC
jgi:broad specificity phosphatase PhoE